MLVVCADEPPKRPGKEQQYCVLTIALYAGDRPALSAFFLVFRADAEDMDNYIVGMAVDYSNQVS